MRPPREMILPASPSETAAFDRLARPVQKWIRGQGWAALRPIQAEAVAAVLEGEADIIITASTAGGKTEAAFLPMISQMLAAPTAGFATLYIGPLKALINDQYQRLEDICRETALPVTPWHGDVAAGKKHKALKNPAGILLITPESLEALFVRRGSEIPRLFAQTRCVVIDELHTFLDAERGVQLMSLLNRLEMSVGHRIRRVGLSATLGDDRLAAQYLRPQGAQNVVVLKDASSQQALKIQLRGYTSGDEDTGQGSTTGAISAHLFQHLRGSQNLIFAGSRNRVEIYADTLRQLGENSHVPQEFYPHHASLSKDHRAFVEGRLKDKAKPTSAVCTSTLELGIDIGDVACVAQIGAPFTVAALRQRLGRSGRREGQPAVLRQYAIEATLDGNSSVVDRLRLGLIRAIAMIELLLEGWCEPPKAQALHLSTLTHQVLSVIAERGGASARRLYVTLCEKGPFTSVDQALFLRLLRQIGSAEVGLIEQSADQTLLLGKAGERLVEHYSFYAVFQTPEEFRLVHDGRELGTLPIDNVLIPGMTLVFSGRRWAVVHVDDRERVIQVTPSTAGVPPVFGGDPGDIHDRVIQKMQEVFAEETVPAYLDEAALALLSQARQEFRRQGLQEQRILPLGEGRFLVFTWVGSVKTATLALALQGAGCSVEAYDGALEVKVSAENPDIIGLLTQIKAHPLDRALLAEANLMIEKFHPFLNAELLIEDAMSSRLDFKALPHVVLDVMV